LHLVPLGHNPIGVSEIVQASTSKKFDIGDQFILAAGTLEPRKNIPNLLKAFEKIVYETESQLVLAGPIGWGVSLSELLGSVSKATQDKIIVTGAVTREELAALYSRANAFCYPSFLEGFGLPVLEAMSYGAPVVTSKDRSTEEVSGVAALTVDPLSVSEIAEALRLVLTDTSVAKELGELGRARAKLFTWEATAASTVEVYRRLL
jgi:glycosyltransferase involved in cell wall biosynthesis